MFTASIDLFILYGMQNASKIKYLHTKTAVFDKLKYFGCLGPNSYYVISNKKFKLHLQIFYY